MGIKSIVGSVKDLYDNVLAESVIGLYKAEVIAQRGLWHNLRDVEFATLEEVDWFTTFRRPQPWWLDSNKPEPFGRTGRLKIHKK